MKLDKLDYKVIKNIQAQDINSMFISLTENELHKLSMYEFGYLFEHEYSKDEFSKFQQFLKKLIVKFNPDLKNKKAR